MLALFAALLHSGIWPLLAAASASDLAGGQLIEICTSDGVKLIANADAHGEAPVDPSPLAAHQDCSACVCSSGDCGAAACALSTDAVLYHVAAGFVATSAVAARSATPYAISHSRGPPAG